MTRHTAAVPSSGVSLALGGGSWSDLSDRNVKANFAAVDGRTLPANLNSIPMQSWNYQAQSPPIRHLGTKLGVSAQACGDQEH